MNESVNSCDGNEQVHVELRSLLLPFSEISESEEMKKQQISSEKEEDVGSQNSKKLHSF